MIYIKKITNLHDYSSGDEGYPFGLPVVKGIREFELHNDVTFLIGENGSGKSTLVEAIAVSAGFNPEGGTRNFNFATAETHSRLFEDLRITRGAHREKDGFFMRAESYYNVSTEIDRIGDGIHRSYGGKSLHKRSHGESFLATFTHRLGGNGLYIFDEPESALSLQSVFALMVRMKELLTRNSQFIIATHSPVLLAFPGAEIWQVGEDGLEKVEYEQTQQYSLTRYFLNNYEGVIRELLS
jgi:predicted ATPase